MIVSQEQRREIKRHNALVTTIKRGALQQHGVIHSSPVHEWFGLTYAAWLVLPRLLLSGMPLGWQKRFVKCLKEFESVTKSEAMDECYRVIPVRNGKLGRENRALTNYRHGNAKNFFDLRMWQLPKTKRNGA